MSELGCARSLPKAHQAHPPFEFRPLNYSTLAPFARARRAAIGWVYMGRFAAVFCWVIALLMSASMSARASSGDWLYDVDVPVTDQSTEVRSAAFRQALLVALKRITGLNDVPTTPAVTSALEAPQRFYVEYRYHEVENPVAGALPAKVPMLSVRFAENAIQKLVAEAGLPLWSSNRPTTLAWIAVSDGANRSVLGANDKSPLLNSIRAHGRERGLPLLFPAMDLDDQSAVTDSVVASGASSPAIERASERYRPDQILVGRAVHGANDAWAVDWQLMQHGTESKFRFESPNADAAGAAVVDRLVADLVARYVVVGGGSQERLQIRVDGISDVAQYGALLKYLGRLEYIDSVQIEEVSLNAVMLSLHTRTPWDRLRDLLALDGRLVPSDTVDVGAERRVLVWRGDTRQ